MISRISNSNHKALKLFHWVLFAMHPLTLEQLRFAYAVEEGMDDLDPKQRLPFRTFIDLTLGLLIVDRVSNTVRVAHSTMKDYLTQHFFEHFPLAGTNGHLLLARTCLTFLSFRAFSTESGRARFHSGGDLSPFFEYAAFQWGHHAREAGDDKETCDMAVRWLLSERMQQVHIVRKKIRQFDFLSCDVKPPSPLYEACYFGLCSQVAELLSLGQDVTVLGSNGRGPLYSAVCQNHLAVVQLLFKCWNLDVNVQNDEGVTPLHAASRSGHLKIVQHFLTLPRIKIPSFLPPSFRFFLRFFLRFFVPSSWTWTVEVNAQDVNGWTALISAAQSGHTDIVDLLLQHPDIDINIRDNHGWTALTRAVDGGHTESVRRLLRNEGIDMAASKVREVELWESVESGCELFAQGEHMSLPYDLRRQLGLPEMATRQ
jgi:hypothetical protein